METINCPRCEAANRYGSKFCFNCGEGLETYPSERDARPENPEREPPKRSRRLVGGLVVFAALIGVLCLAAIFIGLRQSRGGTNRLFHAGELPSFTDEWGAADEDRVAAVAQIFTDPRRREPGPGRVRLDLLAGNIDFYVGQTIVVEGILSQRTLIYDLLEEDWSKAYAMTVWAEGASIPLIYRGQASHLEIGDTILVEGVVELDSGGIHADRVIQLAASDKAGPAPEDYLSAAWIINGLAWGAGILILLFRARRFRRANSKLTSVVGLLTVSLLIASCEIRFSTTINANGTGIVSVYLQDTKENVDFSRQIPGVGSYMLAWIDTMRAAGALVDVWTEGELETFYIQRQLGAISDIAALTERDLAEGPETNWVTILTFREADMLVYRYIAQVDTTVLYRQTTDMDSQAQDEIKSQLDATNMTYDVSLPGEIVYINAGEVRSNRIFRTIRMNEVNEIVVEGRLPVGSGVPDPLIQKSGQALFISFLLAAILLVVGIRDYRIPKGYAVERAG